MLHSSKLIAFVGTRDGGRAKAFYGDVLGLRLIREEPAALVFDAHGTMLRVSIVPELTAAKYTVLGWDVEDIRGAVESLGQQGVRFERFEFLHQDGLGIWTAPNGDQVAWFKDADGNLLSVSQFAKA